MTSDGQLVRVIAVEPLQGFVLRLSFSDGTTRQIDVEEFFRGPVFEALRADPELFRKVRVESGAIVWPNGADMDPGVLHGSAQPAWKEDDRGSQRAG
jgi:hypothetical protein